MPDQLEVGRITKPHGLKGDVLVKFVTDRTVERTEPGSELSLASGRVLVVERASPHQDRWIVHFAGVDTREAAESLHSQLLFAPPLKDTDEVFVHEVIGRRLLTPDGIDHGEVVAVIDNPASDLMELESGLLVPMAFYVSHDQQTVTVEVPDGLLTNIED
ncbi:MAG: ribosome maturation factor RimM [Acidimicrobiia bacterium]|nr:ribosome maturation factor RimM [Acidimicrobiia bacterium]